MKQSPFIKALITTGLSAITLAVTNHALASSYQLTHYLYSAVAVGDAGAGGAALAEDASTVFTNPAGMVRINTPQIILGANYLNYRAKFNGSNTWSSTLFTPPLNTYTETGSATSNLQRVLPFFHFAMPLPCGWSAGVSAAPIYGVGTMWDNDSVLRYNSTKTELKVLDISPAVAYRIDNQWSLGAGVDFVYAYLVYRAMAGLPSIATALEFPVTTYDTLSKNTATRWGYGGHVGVLYQMTPCTRFGFQYRSQVNMNLQGNSKFTGPLAVNGGNTLENLSARLVLPPVYTLSAYQGFGPCWALEGTVEYTQWSNVPRNVILQNVAVPLGTAVTVPWNYRDTWLFALGGNYQINPQWLVRAGLSYDQSPVRSSQRIAAVPDSNRFGTSIGGHYQWNRCIGFDLGWTHLFFRNSSYTAPTIVSSQTSTPNGTFKSHADIVSGQVVWNFA